jgi:hypothetical protein
MLWMVEPVWRDGSCDTKVGVMPDDLWPNAVRRPVPVEGFREVRPHDGGSSARYRARAARIGEAGGGVDRFLSGWGWLGAWDGVRGLRFGRGD